MYKGHEKKMKHIDSIILVNDLEASKAFYTKLMGLEILHDWSNMVVFKERFSIHKADALQPPELISGLIVTGNQGHGNIVLYFEAGDLETEYQKLVQAGVKVIHGIVQVPWQKLFRVYDPDGHIIEIGSPFKPA
jgi:predicted enzyme related to lactoylglutathione lyase